MTFPKKRWITLKILGLALAFITFFSQESTGQADNPFYILYNEGDHPRQNPASIYRLDHKNCELEHFVELNIYPHVPSLHDWTDIAISPGGTFYFIEAGGRVFEIDTITGELELYFTYDNPNNTYLLGLAIDYKGNFYALGQYEADIHIYYPETGEQYRSPPTASYEVGLDLTFYNNRIFFHNFWEIPKTFLTTDLLGTQEVDSLFSHNLPVNLGGMSTYADSCQSYYVIGSPNVIVTTLGNNQSVYKVDIENATFEPLCDRFILPNPDRGVFGAAHRYEYRASFPPVELHPQEYVLEIEDDCRSFSATLTVKASGGIDSLLYALNDNNFSRDSVFLLEEPGWYEIIAKDSRSCFWTDSFYFDPPPGLSFGEIIIGEEACPGAENGSVEVSVFGGYSPYVYTLNGGNPQSDGVFDGLTDGDYFIEMIDSMGCRIDTLVQLGTSFEPDFELMVEDEYCQSSNGRIEVSGSSLASMEFSLDASDFQDSPVFEDLPAGIYSVWARDSLDCLYSETAEIARIEDVIFTHLADSSCVHEVPSLDSLWLTSAAGCDSVIVTQRIPADFTTVLLQDYDCFAQQTYSDSTWIQPSDDCDTLLITNYSPAPTDSIFITRDTCSWQSIADEVFLYSNQFGCDSIVRITYNHLMPDILLLDSIHCDPPIRDSIFYLNSLGCDSLVVIDYVQSAPMVDLGPDIAVPEGTEVVLQPSIHGDLSHFNWQPTDYLDDPLVFQPTARPEESILYTLEITDIHGCSASDQIRITVVKEDPAIYIPNAFSPNTDGINDYFTAYFRDGRYRIEQLTIWDRWGGRIFNCTNHPCQWDGTTGGEWAAGGTYVFEFLLVSDDGEELIRRGEVLLVR